MMHTEIHSDAVGRVACARLWDSAIGETAGASDPPYGKWLPIANSPGNGMDIGCILPGVLSKNRKNFVIGCFGDFTRIKLRLGGESARRRSKL